MIQDEYGKVVKLSQDIVQQRGWVFEYNGFPSIYRLGTLTMSRIGDDWTINGRTIHYLHELIAIEVQ